MTSGKREALPPHAAGFAYIFALLLVAIVGLALTAYAQAASHEARRLRETQLLWVGEQFRNAIGLYYERSPGTAKQFPKSLEDLLRDQRFLTVQRYLRTIYLDPMTGKPDWGLVRAPDGGISGVYSLALGSPLKSGNFSGRELAFSDAKSYADWKFTYQPHSAR